MDCVSPVEILYFVSKHCDINWKLPKAAIPFCDLTFLMEGTAVYWIDGKKLECKKGEAVFLPAGSIRMARTEGMECVAFNLKFYGEIPSLPSKINWANNHRVKRLLQDAGSYWYSALNYRKLKCAVILQELLYELLMQETVESENSYVKKMKEFIFSNLDCKITVKEIAAEVGLHPAYCGAVFLKEEGQSLLSYCNRVKMEKAAEFLTYENCSVTEAAERVGFDDIAYFSKLFKAVKGDAPSQYRIVK